MTEFRTTLSESVMFDKLVDEQFLQIVTNSNYLANVSAKFSNEEINISEWPTNVDNKTFINFEQKFDYLDIQDQLCYE